MTTAQKQFKTAQADEIRRRDKMLAVFRAEADDATLTRWATAERVLIPGVETIADWPAPLAPATLGEMRRLVESLRQFAAKKKS